MGGDLGRKRGTVPPKFDSPCLRPPIFRRNTLYHKKCPYPILLKLHFRQSTFHRSIDEMTTKKVIKNSGYEYFWSPKPRAKFSAHGNEPNDHLVGLNQVQIWRMSSISSDIGECC